ncbi:MAG: hypothetical protein E6J70_15065 [Deltaproteobacteria bacterium]|nr:MAG: hypothetical protein E6J70_15065 [Deltaproteobacteria bacterium]
MRRFSVVVPGSWWFLLGLAGLLVVSVAPLMASGNVAKYALFGTVQKAADPTNSQDQVISINTTPTNSVGGAFRPLNQTIHSLDGLISLDYYFVANGVPPGGKTCGGGSPRIQLAVDTDGDGSPNGNAFGYLGSGPFGTGCAAPGRWTHENFTDNVPRWDLSQFGGGMTMTWSTVEAFFAAQPHEQVLNGVLVEDACSFVAANCGGTFYDTVQIGGGRTLENWSDTTGP